MTDRLVVAFDESEEDCPVLVVGRYGFRNDCTIIALFANDEAIELYNKLIGNIKVDVSE